jgi:hypothetical protein
MLEAVVEYTGVEDVISFSYSMGQGVVPGVMSFQITPQRLDKIAPYGTLKITYGKTKLKMKNCLSDRASYQLNSSGEVIAFYATDYRWAWHYSTITGTYNLKDIEGKDLVLSGSKKKTPDDVFGYSKRNLRELVQLCFEAMGVDKANVSRVPENVYPEVSWDNVIAAQALHSLLEQFDLRVCPNWKGGAAVYKVGRGGKLTDYDKIESIGQESDPVERPKEIRFITQPIKYNVDFELEPVGEDVDGKIRPIEDLSYYVPEMEDWDPAAGFDSLIPEQDTDYAYTVAALAQKCIFKWWRVKIPEVSGKTVGGWFGNHPAGPPNLGLKKFIAEYGDPKYVEQFLPLLPVQAETILDDISKRRYSKEPVVFGKFFDDGDIGSLNTNDPAKIPWKNLDQIRVNQKVNVRYIVTFSSMNIDHDRGIVMFDQPITAQVNKTTYTFSRPRLWLRCGCHIKDLKTGLPVRYSKVKGMAKKSPASTVTVSVDEAAPYYGATDDKANNIDEVEKIISTYDAEVDETFKRKDAETATYIGIISVKLDGAIREASYTINDGGATTVVMRNTDKSRARTLGYLRRTKLLQDEILKRQEDRRKAIELWQKRAEQVRFL